MMIELREAISLTLLPYFYVYVVHELSKVLVPGDGGCIL